MPTRAKLKFKTRDLFNYNEFRLERFQTGVGKIAQSKSELGGFWLFREGYCRRVCDLLW